MPDNDELIMPGATPEEKRMLKRYLQRLRDNLPPDELPGGVPLRIVAAGLDDPIKVEHGGAFYWMQYECCVRRRGEVLTYFVDGRAVQSPPGMN